MTHLQSLAPLQWPADHDLPEDGMWKRMPSLRNNRYALSAVVHNSNVYAIGGYDDGKVYFRRYLSSVEQFTCNPRSSQEKWDVCTELHLPRSHFAAVELEGTIFAIGGQSTDETILDSVELWRASPDASASFSVSPNSLSRPRSHHCAASLAGHIYVFGGAVAKNLPLLSVESYNSKSHAWTEKVGSWKEGRQEFASGTLASKGCIFAIGGLGDNGTPLSTVERFDPRDHTAWRRVCDMQRPRHGHAAAVVHDLIYAIGGYPKRRDVEIYEPRMNRWFKGPALLSDRCYSAAVNYQNRIVVVGGWHQSSRTVEELPLVPSAACTISAKCRARALVSPSENSDFQVRLSSATYLVDRKEVPSVKTEINLSSNGFLLDDLDASRPLGFPVPSAKEVKIDVSDIEIDDDVWVRPSRVRLLVVGNARVGKTSLIKNLSSGGEKFDPTENSTEVGDVKTMEISIRNHAWTDTTMNTGTTLLSQLMQQQVAKGKPETLMQSRNTDDTTSGQANEEHAMSPPASAHVDNSAGATTENQVPSRSTSQSSPNVAREHVTANERIDVTSRVLTELEGETLSVSILDFAGQNVFRVFDPLFFGKQSLYFCVFSLRVLHDAHGNGILEKAIEENVISWLRIIANVRACNVSENEKSVSKVVLIGTHGGFIENESSQAREDFLNALNACLKCFLKNPQLSVFFQDAYVENDGYFTIVENNPDQRIGGLKLNQEKMMTQLSDAIRRFHLELPKVLLRNLVVESLCKNCKDVVLPVDRIRNKIPGIASVCKSNAEVKECFDDLVALGCLFACSSDEHMIVLRPDVFIQTCAQLIPQTDGKGGLLHVSDETKAAYKYLLENASIIPSATAQQILEGHLRTNRICSVDSHKLVAKQVCEMLVTLGVVVPMDPESKFVFFPQWHRHCDSLGDSPDALDSRWKTECSEKAGFKHSSCTVRCVGLRHLFGIIDGVVTDLHFWRFMTFLGRKNLYPPISDQSPPALGLDVIVCRPDGSVQCRIRLDRKQGTSSIFHFDTLSSPGETDVPDLVALLTAFLSEDPMSRSVLSCTLVIRSESVCVASLSSCTRNELTDAFNANVRPFLDYFARYYDSVFKEAVHALYNINPGLSGSVLTMDDRHEAVHRWMSHIVLNPMHKDGVWRFLRFLSKYPDLLADVSAILFPPTPSAP
eukprot:ANDGO_07311.mRNA.1 Kelch-like protein diablo